MPYTVPQHNDQLAKFERRYGWRLAAGKHLPKHTRTRSTVKRQNTAKRQTLPQDDPGYRKLRQAMLDAHKSMAVSGATSWQHKDA